MSHFCNFHRITSCVRNVIFHVRDHKSAQLVALEESDLWRVLTPDSQSLPGVITIEELMSALQHLNPGKAAGPDSICSELVLHVGSEMKSWLCKFPSSCLQNLKIPKIWRRSLVVEILKPSKPPGDPKGP